jgi:hypothetical protein
MACPMTSGSAALVRQAHPLWNGDQIKAALVNTADPSMVVGYNGRIDGSGFLQVQKATDTDAVATTADGLDSLSFGYVPGSGTYTDTRTFTVSNYGPAAVTYNLTATVSGGATVSATPSSITVPGNGGSMPVVVTLGISASTFAAQPSDSTSVLGLGGVVTFRGAVTATPTTSGAGIRPLRIPLLAAPRGLSSATAGPLTPYVKQGTSNVYTTSTTVTNTGVHSGTADLYAWGIHDANDLGTAANDVRDVGVQSFSDGRAVFVIKTYNQVSTAATQEYDVAIDLQHDGKADYFVVGADIGAVTTGTFDGRFGAFVFDAKTGARVGGIFGTESPMNSSTVEIPFLLSTLGLKAGNADFNYAVNAYSVYGGAVDTTSAATYDAAHPGVSTGAFASVPAGGSVSIPLWADYDKLQSAPALGWLSVTVDDAGGAAQADEIPLGTVK